MYFIYQQQSGGYDEVKKYYKTEKIFIRDLKHFLKVWVYIKPTYDSDNSDEDEENYNIDDVN